jgi:hypothetical protein
MTVREHLDRELDQLGVRALVTLVETSTIGSRSGTSDPSWTGSTPMYPIRRPWPTSTMSVPGVVSDRTATKPRLC